MRGLSEKFMEDLKFGELGPLLKIVKADDTICLEIRDEYINIYYRGGSILKVWPKKGGYFCKFDSKYCIDNGGIWETFDTACLGGIQDYIKYMPQLKREMDYWFSQYPKLEREFQQLVLRENNLSTIAKDTDYFISDIEYGNSENGSRFDMTGIKWISSGRDRKSPSLAIIEVKYGDSAMAGKAGILKHFADIDKFYDAGKMNDLYTEVETQLNQKVELGLINGITKKIEIDRFVKAEYILLCANHKPTSRVMYREIRKVSVSCPEIIDKIQIKIAKSSNMGYGLYAIVMLPFSKINE